MMVKLKRVYCTSRSTVLKLIPAMVKEGDESGVGGPTAVGLDPIYDGVQSDVYQLQIGHAVMTRRRSRSQEVKAATWNVSSRPIWYVDLVTWLSLYTEERRLLLCSREEVEGWKWEDAWCYWLNFVGKAVIRGLLVLMSLFLRYGLTVSMWSESTSGSCL